MTPSFKSWFARWRKPRVPKPREGANTYVANGDKIWGNSITVVASDDGTVRVCGWLSRAPFPVEGDELLVPMRSGRWGRYVFTERGWMHGVSDGFTGRATAVGYAEQEPRGEYPDELFDNLPVFTR